MPYSTSDGKTAYRPDEMYKIELWYQCPYVLCSDFPLVSSSLWEVEGYGAPVCEGCRTKTVLARVEVENEDS